MQAAAEQQAVAVEATLEAATARISAVRAALEQARHADLATTIRSGLHLGDPCSVCGNTITQLPIGLDESRIGEAEAAVREAEQLMRDEDTSGYDQIFKLMKEAKQNKVPPTPNLPSP